MDEQGAPTAETIRDLERRRLRSLVEADTATARSLHADDYELVTPGGRVLSRDAYVGEIASGELDYLVFEAVSPVEVRIAPGLAVLRYQARIEVRFPDGVDRGVFWHTDVWELRDGGWQAVRSQATRTRPPEPAT